ncbi:Glucan 1,3-beta-glucosidase [Fulvia fulva]|uniref:glucan 1,3-beta-glucosidase n=1 Tax=Passalora fulva TaxID=5499 RepID=A0A9Q8PIK1_PASFU|nr:Glucan 1,3-beta-glucosidase [Fulvia fulva]KAK4626524.1 Glucan 1,3-beta-glucosidase [Fulvia fulva]KAK4628426.1 Glucan 1,3-beta-glucosidase [Fulvia fulva]UJO23128.1 Glucan 1,3-beta-glucosidase [Fulvia fulva]WPV13335.1 Glucan 1,3-beta-glucosidase [Fulvia fulva]WPV29204.1 Glucan 1,3-beta-glucosidase [Fulvia fulva]
MGILNIATAVVALLAAIGTAAPAGLVSAFDKRDLKFAFGQEKVRGVNLGGWFVLEPWITPSIFENGPADAVDEYTYTQQLGKDEAKKRLESHWSSFYNEGDFAQMKNLGLNFVRIPVGYWSVAPLPDDPYVQGAYAHMRQAVEWAGNNGLKVMIDLHGAPRSQNGFDNSGKRGPVGWTQGESVANTIKALNKIRDDFASNPAVAAIELLNEPMGPQLDQNVLKQFYMDGWGNLRDSNVAVTFHDAFIGVNSWNDWGAGMSNLLLDTHHYEVFDSGALQMGIQDHLNSACGFGNQMTANNKWTISGEWSGAMTDCAKWLNGRGIGARYDGTFNKDGQGSSYIGSCDGKFQGTVAGLGEADRNNIASFIRAQIAAYEKADGWIFWTWKNEAAPEWHFKDLAAAGMIPQPFSSAAGACG